MHTLIQADLSPILICGVVVLVAGLGGILPFSPTEALLLAVAAIAPEWLLFPVVGLATASQMSTKTLLFAGSRKAERILCGRRGAMLARVRARVAGRRWLQFAMVLVSALAGFPPFYMVTMVCGALRLPLKDYLVAGSLGRGIRFSGLVMLPQLIA